METVERQTDNVTMAARQRPATRQPSPRDAGQDNDNRTYTITQLSEEFGVTTRAIRFYEDKALLSPGRQGQSRVYSSRDRVRLQLILQGKRVGFTLSEIREMLDLYDLQDGRITQLEVSCEKFRDRISKLKAQREDIEHSIEALESGLSFFEATLAEKRRQRASGA